MELPESSKVTFTGLKSDYELTNSHEDTPYITMDTFCEYSQEKLSC